jgi:hypothetical protein
MVVFILSAVDPRMTIHHSSAPERQGIEAAIQREVPGTFA